MHDDYEATIFLPRGRSQGHGNVFHTPADLAWFVGNLPPRMYVIIEYLDGTTYRGWAEEAIPAPRVAMTEAGPQFMLPGIEPAPKIVNQTTRQGTLF